MSVTLSSEYLAWIKKKGVSECCTEGEPGYLALWLLGEIEANNKAYRVPLYAPGFLGFGTDGGGELLAFDASGAVFKLPLVGMEPKCAQRIADSWNEICQRIDLQA